MDLKKYDKLRNKIETKNFEGKNRDLDKWLYLLSFLGNIGSIFFAFFLLFPALINAISNNLSENLSWFLAMISTVVILISFESIKRLLVKNLSFDLVKNKFNVFKLTTISWVIFTLGILVISFYLSLNGAKNFASTKYQRTAKIESKYMTDVDSLKREFEIKKEIYVNENVELRGVNKELRNKLNDTPLKWITARKEYQNSINENVNVINSNEEIINKLDDELNNKIVTINQDMVDEIKETESNDIENIILFIILSTSIELLIIIGIYFREYYEYTLYLINKEKLEKIYRKRDRYKKLINYIYENGKNSTGYRVIAASKLIDLVKENTTIQEPKKFVDEFMSDMEKLKIFVIQGKRRLINESYYDALHKINNFDDTMRIIESLK